jgi:uncharacterized protein YegL
MLFSIINIWNIKSFLIILFKKMGICDNNNNRIEKASIAQKSSYTYCSTATFTNNYNLLNNNNSSKAKKYPQEEHYYKLIKDSNKIDILNPKSSDPNAQKLELFFSLTNIENPQLFYSFSITIINNITMGIRSYLGNLEESKGEDINFGNSFEIDFFPNRIQLLLIKPIVNKSKTSLEFQYNLREIISKNGMEQYIQGCGLLKIYFNRVNIDTRIILENQYSNFKFNINLYQMSHICSQGVFFILYHHKDSHKKRPIYKSNNFFSDSIRTNDIKIQSDFLANNLYDKISIYIYTINQQKKPIAKGSFNLHQLNTNSSFNNMTQIDLYSTYDNSNNGNCYIDYNSQKKICFADKLAKKRMQINLEIAIDYTYSNKPPDDPSSNHYLNPFGLNDYEIAMKYCSDILAPYDADQLFPVYGFGGIPAVLNGMPNYNNKVSHCFNINFQENAEIQGVENILKVYRQSLQKIQLSGNTKFSFVIQKVMDNINHDLKYNKKENHYYILLILTDGVINDMRDTKDLIVEASSLPLSIVIIGIGEENFKDMEKLDGDEDELEDSKGKKRKRDIVQFIALNNFKKNKLLNKGTDFVEEVLKEIPRQIDEYYN